MRSGTGCDLTFLHTGLPPSVCSLAQRLRYRSSHSSPPPSSLALALSRHLPARATHAHPTRRTRASAVRSLVLPSAQHTAQPRLPTAVPKCWDDPYLCNEGSSSASRRSTLLGLSRSSSVFLSSALGAPLLTVGQSDRLGASGGCRATSFGKSLRAPLVSCVSGSARAGTRPWGEEVRLLDRDRVRLAHYRAQKEACGVRRAGGRARCEIGGVQ
jgi:hypothetical protein